MDASLPKERLGDLLGVSIRTIDARIAKKTYQLNTEGEVLLASAIEHPLISEILSTQGQVNRPASRLLTVGESFAGAGGMALGFEKAGYDTTFVLEYDKHAAATLKHNRPKWDVIEADICNVDFTQYHGRLDVMAGGFPCQPFSTTGSMLGLNDTRGTLFYEFARSILESEPKAFVAENVSGLLSHDKGRTLQTICAAFNDIGYTLIDPRILKGMLYQVPQKRDRLFLIGFRSDLMSKINFSWPYPCASNLYTLKDALKAGTLFDVNVPASEGVRYSDNKAKVLDKVPAGGNWKDLPVEIQKTYLGGAYNTSGGKTSFAKRLSWDTPCNTLLCSPSQKQTDRCHPDETRPLTTREYARIQTFPDNWEFLGNVASIYKQIGNAVPVNLAYAVACAVASALN